MERQVSLDEISDGRLYGLNDMVKADCGDCKGCSACCRGMGDSIVLDPMDIFRLCGGLHRTFEELLQDCLELRVADGIILPNLKMERASGSCLFLDDDGRCSIHPVRPGICRIFPLGRVYEDHSFRYFLQIHECRKEVRTKVKVKKWIDTPDAAVYDQYITDWHYFLKELQRHMEEAQENAQMAEKGEAEKTVRDETQEAVQPEEQKTVQDETQEAVQGETQKADQDETQKAVQGETQVAKQHETWAGFLKKTICMAVLKEFYMTPYDGNREFYPQFYERLERQKEHLLSL